ncbi:MAG: hypothetical protein ACPF98_08930 [Prochlorococcaceae cyanobacterium]
MPRDRKGAQLSLELEPQLLERLRARAAAEGRPLAVMVRRWLEAGLSGALEQQAGPAAVPDLADLVERVERLEAELAQIRRSPERVEPLPAPQSPAPAAASPARVNPPSPERGSQITPSGDAITTAQLAELTGTNRSAWNNWARDKQPGAVRKMPPDVGQWRLVGKATPQAGGPARWLWEPV